MPIIPCTKNGKRGHKYGPSGKCYVGYNSKARAAAQGRAIQASKHRSDAAEDAQMQIKYKRSLLLRKSLPKKLPVWQYPDLIENVYAKELISYISKIGDIVEEQIIPHVQSLIDERNADVPETIRTDDWAENAERVIESAKISFDKIDFDPQYSASNIGDKTNAWNDKQWRKMLKASLGVDVYQREPWLNSELNSFVKENTSLITKMKEDTISDISSTLQRSIKAGESYGTIADKLQKRVDVGKSRATLIARDQVGKLNGQFTELRQTNIGVEEYTWITAQDERVRASHRANNGKKFKWNNAPATGHPGSAVQCRCYPEPDFTPVFKEAGITPHEKLIPVRVKSVDRRQEMADRLKGQYPPRERPTEFNILHALMLMDNVNMHGMTLGKSIAGGMGYIKTHRSVIIKGLAGVAVQGYVKPFLLRKAAIVAKAGGLHLRAVASPHLNKLYKSIGMKRVGKTFVGLNKNLNKILKNVNGLLPRVSPKRMKFFSIRKKPTVIKKVKPSPGAEVTAPKGVTAEKLPKNVNAIVRQQELSIRYEKDQEFGILMSSKNGKIIKTWEGDENSITINKRDYPLFKNNIFTHNHSNNTSFSPNDIANAIEYNSLQKRVTSPKYTYIAQRAKGKKDWFDGIPDDYKFVTARGDKIFADTKFKKEWMHEFSMEYSRLNNRWLYNNKGKYVSKKIQDTWMEDATHNVSKYYSKKFGMHYTRIDIAKEQAATRRKEKIKKKSLEDLRKEAKTFKDKLQEVNPKVLRTLYKYTSEYEFEKINGLLSGRLKMDEISAEHVEQIRDHISDMDNIFNMKYPKYVGDSYRGMNLMNNNEVRNITNKMKVGASVKMDEFVSSSRTRKQSESFVTPWHQKDKVNPIPGVMIKVKGKSGLFIDNVLSKVDEEEILFNRGTKFKVTSNSVTKGKFRDTIEVEMEEM